MQKITRRRFIKTAGLSSVAFLLNGCSKNDYPNIVYILADDLGYGDVSCLNKNSKIPTPNIDELAKEGMIFTDAHSGSAVCTPTRYGILTGRYCWRSRLKRGVLGGYSPYLIEKGRTTVASMLKQYGYDTACIGKWHLGMDWPTKTGQKFADTINPNLDTNIVDFNKPIKNGPNELGFDYYYGISASLDMPPHTYIENDRVTEPPTEITEGRARPENWRRGLTAPSFKHKQVLPQLTKKAVEHIRQREKRKPFFLYFPLSAPHMPVLPTKQFLGKSRAGNYGDFVCQVDYTAGQVIKAIKQKGLYQNTLVIFTSDNGSTFKREDMMTEFGHAPNYHFRGRKSDVWDGGHRIPFIASWPAKIKAGTTCNDLICLSDLMATAAEIVGKKLGRNEGQDSESILPNLIGEVEKPAHEAIVHHSYSGYFAIRKGKWKLLLCKGSGGWSLPEGKVPPVLPPMQLYDMSKDVNERKNLYYERPDIVKELTELLERYKKQGYSRL